MRVPVIVPKTKRGGGVYLLVLGVIAIIMGIALISDADIYPPEPIDASLVSFEELTSRSGYYTDDAVIIDQYGYTSEDDKVKSIECAVGFAVKDGQWVITSMKLNTSDPLYSTVDAYLNDDTMVAGDLRMPMSFTTSSLGTKFAGFLTEFTDKYFSAEDGYKTVHLEMTYRGETREAYVENVAKDKRNSTIGGIVAAVVGAVMLGCGIVMLINQKRRAAEARAAAEAQAALMPTDETTPPTDQTPSDW